MSSTIDIKSFWDDLEKSIFGHFFAPSNFSHYDVWDCGNPTVAVPQAEFWATFWSFEIFLKAFEKIPKRNTFYSEFIDFGEVSGKSVEI